MGYHSEKVFENFKEFIRRWQKKDVESRVNIATSHFQRTKPVKLQNTESNAQSVMKTKCEDNDVCNPRKRKSQSGRSSERDAEKFKFEETKLGFMLRHEPLVVFSILMKSLPSSPFVEPPVDLIRTISQGRVDPAFRKVKFKRYLEEYERTGLCYKRVKRMTPEWEIYYERIREVKMRKFVKKNRKRINSYKSKDYQ